MSGDWLDDAPSAIAVPVELPADPRARLQLVTECWSRLTEAQKRFLTAYRANGLNARKANRMLTGASYTPHQHTGWMHQTDYKTIVRIWRGEVSDEALNRDRLLARHDDIVETALTPRPVLHEGIMVLDSRPGAPPGAVLEEVDVSAAARANETLMKAAGILKDKELEVNIGMVGPALEIRVMQKDGNVLDVTPQGVPVALPEPEPEADGDEWLLGR